MATYSQGYVTQLVADDAAFRTRGKWFSDQLQAIGWTLVEDSGDINWATVSKPGAANTVAGYEIRKSTDGKTDIYIKIEYGSGSGATNMSFWITAGEGSDGAGVITGDKTTRVQAPNNSTGAVSCTDYLCGNTARFSLLMAANTSASTMTAGTPGIVLQRTTDASGVDDSNGFIVWAFGYNSSKHEQVNFSSGSSGQRSGIGALLQLSAPIPGSAGAIPVFPAYVATSSEFLLARDVVAIPTAYAALASTHTFSLLGSNRTFIALYGNTVSSGYFYEAAGAAVALSLCFRWE